MRNEKMKSWKAKLVVALVILSMCTTMVLGGCKKEEAATFTPETTASDSQPQETPPAEVTEPPATEPTEDTEPTEEEPDETEEEIPALQVGRMGKHPKGKNGDLGIYFTMEPNEIPVDTSWKTEYRPATFNTILLYRDGQTIQLGNTMTGMVIKYSETDYYLKLEEWNIGKHFPIRDGDVIQVEGRFQNTSLEVYFEIEKTYILVSEGLVFFSEEYPDASAGVSVKYVGSPTSHPNGKTTDGIFFKLEKNSVPYDDWSLEYSPASEDSVQLIRNGKTYNIGNKAAGTIVKYSDTEYYLKLEKWIIKDYYPIQDGDIIVLKGKFVNSGVSTVFSIDKTYISINEGLLNFSTTYPTESGVEAQLIPTMLKHPNGFTGTGVYFQAAEENTLPYDGWSVEYFPREAGCIKLIRDGQTYDIANPDAGTIVKYSEKDYYFKLEQWIYKNYFPFVDGDILVVEGKFVNAGLAGLMEIGKTYISISGGMAYFSTEYPEGPVGPTKIQAGTMQSHPDGWNQDGNGGLFFKMALNDAPFATDWSMRYVPTTTGAIKLIRDGVTYEVANTGAEMIAKYRDDSYYLEFWPISQKPIVDGDVLVVEGSFVNAANNVALIIDKTYITFENGEAAFSTSDSVVIEAGYMHSHPNGWNTSNNEGLYFSLSENEIPFDGWSVEYEPVSAAAVQLVRGGETYNIGQPSKGTIVKYGTTDYYLKLVDWTIGDYAPIVPGDMLVIEGQFKNVDNGVVFNISRSVITVGEDYSLTFTEEEPVDSTIQAGMMSSHPKGWNTANNNGLYFSLISNDIPYTDDWTTVYCPTSTDNIQLIRDGQTHDVSLTDREYIVKFEDTGYYLKLEKWTIGDFAPLVPGDVLKVEGKFCNAISGVEFAISTTYITIGEGYVLTFSETAPEEDQDETVVLSGIKPHSNGFNTGSMDGLYFSADANAAPYDSWNIEYTPVEAANYKLVRDGVTYDIGIPNRGTLVKYNETDYYLKFGWCVGDYANTVTIGDTLIIEGMWKQNTGGDAVMNIIKTTITIGEGYVLTFQSEDTEPEDPDVTEPEGTEPAANHGPMAADSTNGWTGTGGLYFTMAENDVPYDNWNVRYKPTAESNVKLIRGGVTYDIGHTQRETIVKYSDTQYYFEFWTLADYKPVVVGDIMVVEGDFVNTGNGATLSIAKTTITFNADGTATFRSEGAEPEEPNVTEPEATEPEMTEGLPMLSWDEKAWNTGNNGGFWFTMAANEIPADETWALEYTPVSESVIRLVSDGETVNIAIPGRGTLIKATEEEYYLKLEWNIGEYANTITVGDQLIVEGAFTNETNGVTFTVAKTVITISENYVLTFESENNEETDALNVGAMSANDTASTDKIIYFSLADNDLPYGLTKSDFRPTTAGAIKLIRGGETYEIADPTVKTIVKQTAAKYRLLRSALTMELQAGDILVVDGIFTGGNTNEDTIYNIRIAKTYIFIGEGSVTFDTDPPEEE